MSTLVLEDVGAGSPGQPLRLRFDATNSDVTFEVDSNGELFIVALDGEEVHIGAVGFPSGADILQVQGKLGINSTVFASAFQVVGSSAVLQTSFNQHATPSGQTMLFTNSPNNTIQTFEEWTDGTTLRAEIRSNGGLVNFQSNDVDLSDAEIKDVEPGVIPSTWDRIKALDIVQYRYKDNPNTRMMIGVTAQQVESVEPAWFQDKVERTIPGEEVRTRGGRLKGTTPERVKAIPRTVFNKDIWFSGIRALQEAMERIEALENA